MASGVPHPPRHERGRITSLRPALEPFTGWSRFGALGRIARQLVFRLTRPVIIAEHQVHLQLADSIETVRTDLGLGIRAASIPPDLDPTEIVDAHTDAGPLYLHRTDTVMTPFISNNSFWEADESAFLRATLRPGQTFLDVGANVGYMSVLGGKSVGPSGRVIAIEPDLDNARLLRANLWRNGITGTVLRMAAFSHNGFAGFVRNNANRGDHQLRPDATEATLVPCGRLDDVLGPLRVDVVKIDTQGVDHEVLEGMADLIRSNPDVIILSEFWLDGLTERGVDPGAVLARYDELGFAMGLLSRDGSVRSARPPEVIQACEAWEGRYTNLVLTRRRARGS